MRNLKKEELYNLCNIVSDRQICYGLQGWDCSDCPFNSKKRFSKLQKKLSSKTRRKVESKANRDIKK